MKKHRLSIVDWLMYFLEDHPLVANVWLPILLAMVASLACSWLSKQLRGI